MYIDDKDTIPETDALLSDEEIQYLIDTSRHILLAAASAAEAVATKFSDEASSKQVGDLKITYADGGQAESYKTMAKALRNRAYRRAGSGVYAGGISHADKDTQEEDTDRVQPAFSKGMDDHESSGTTTDRGILEY